MINIGWVVDQGYSGGAEMNASEWLAAAPAGVNPMICPPGAIPEGLDGYVIHNCVSYSESLISKVRGKPVIKVWHDVWNDGDVKLRSWLLTNATLHILVSPKLERFTKWSIKTPVTFIPSPVKPYKPKYSIQRAGAVWLGRLHSQKGVVEAIEYALSKQVPLDIYGPGDTSIIPAAPGITYKGVLKQSELYSTLEKYQEFIFLPTDYDACPRVIFEAWYAGCNITTNSWQGASWWIDNKPEEIRLSAVNFWAKVTSLVTK